MQFGCGVERLEQVLHMILTFLLWSCKHGKERKRSGELPCRGPSGVSPPCRCSRYQKSPTRTQDVQPAAQVRLLLRLRPSACRLATGICIQRDLTDLEEGCSGSGPCFEMNA